MFLRLALPLITPTAYGIVACSIVAMLAGMPAVVVSPDSLGCGCVPPLLVSQMPMERTIRSVRVSADGNGRGVATPGWDTAAPSELVPAVAPAFLPFICHLNE